MPLRWVVFISIKILPQLTAEKELLEISYCILNVYLTGVVKCLLCLWVFMSVSMSSSICVLTLARFACFWILKSLLIKYWINWLPNMYTKAFLRTNLYYFKQMVPMWKLTFVCFWFILPGFIQFCLVWFWLILFCFVCFGFVQMGLFRFLGLLGFIWFGFVRLRLVPSGFICFFNFVWFVCLGFCSIYLFWCFCVLFWVVVWILTGGYFIKQVYQTTQTYFS